MRRIVILSAAALISGCAASVDIQRIKLQSGREYEVAKTRSGVEFADCGTQLVSYLFDEKGALVDSKSERGQALHCDIGVALIRAGGEVGAANQIRRGLQAGADTITNVNEQAQGQLQGQGQLQSSTNVNVNQNTNRNRNRNSNNNHWEGGSVTNHNNNGHHGNNGYGNGGGDGSPNGHEDGGR